MKYTVKGISLGAKQHPGFISLHLLATVEIAPDNGAKETVVIPILAEPDKWKDKFTCRIYSPYTHTGHTPVHTLEQKYGISGLSSVPGLREQARDMAKHYWASEFLPSKAQKLEGTLIPTISSSTELRLKFDELQIGAFQYAGDIRFREKEDGTLVGSAPRHDLHVLLGRLTSGNIEHHSLNDKAARQLIEYLTPVAKAKWDALKLERQHKRAQELRNAIDCCKGTITCAEFQLQEARTKLPELEAELKKVTEG